MVLFWVVAISGAPAFGFDYLEHSFVTDRACLHAQRSLVALVQAAPENTALRARYLALALVCPERATVDYCVDERKAVTAQINHGGERPWESVEHPVTLGDFSGLADHLSKLGPVKGLGGARASGLTEQFFRWFASEERQAGGLVDRVGRMACWNTQDVPWQRIEQDIDQSVGHMFAQSAAGGVPAALLSPLRRIAAPVGPRELAGRYSFTNPHFLDLVLRNHHHFGPKAYDTWLGFHTASLAIAQSSCASTYALSWRESRRLARKLKGFETVRWQELDDAALAQTGCAMLGELTRQRLMRWADRGEPSLRQPVQAFLDTLASPGAKDELEEAALRQELDTVVASLVALIFEGNGLHFLQDGFAGGHVRTIRTRGGLGEARHDHDHDNAEGVTAVLRTRSGDFPFVAYGDSFLLGPPTAVPQSCAWHELLAADASPAEVSTCLIRHQRGLVVASSAASLIDWALDGLLFEPVDAARCAQGPAQSAACNLLPLTAIAAAGELPPRANNLTGVHPSTLPVPPPPFAYESLVTLIAFDVAGSNTQYGLQLTILSELDTFANWLTSYRAAIFVSPGDGDRSRFVGEFSYNFHWRLAARVLLEAGGFGFVGFRGLGEGLSFLAGAGPSAGLVVLPEGWTKIPLEVSLSYRFPLRLFTSRDGFFGPSLGIEAHWLQFGLGLAFM